MRVPRVIYSTVRAALFLGIQTIISVHWVACKRPGCMQMRLEIYCPISTALMWTQSDLVEF